MESFNRCLACGDQGCYLAPSCDYMSKQLLGLFSQELRSKTHKTGSATLLSTSTGLVLEVHLESDFTSLLDDALLARALGYLA